MNDPGADERTRRRVAGGLVAVGLAALPTLALLAGTAWGHEGVRGRFDGALAGLVVITSVGAFTARSRGLRAAGRTLTLVAIAAVLAGGVQALRGGAAATGGGGGSLFLLYLGVGVGAAGLAALGRALGTPRAAAGAVAACVLWTAMAGLFWADPVAGHLPRTRRRSFRQAVLHVDPALALAYGAVGYDRMRSEEVYFDVPLASSFYERPAAGTTGGAWLATGLAAWALALLVGVRRPQGASPEPAAGDGAGGRRRDGGAAADAASAP